MNWFIRRTLFVFVLLVISARSGSAQTVPQDLRLSPSSIVQGGCYTVYVSSGQNMTIDIVADFPDVSGVEIDQWLTMDGNGQAYVCTDPGIPIGTYTITAVRNSAGSGNWLYLSRPINVTPPFNPTNLWLDRTFIQQGGCYVVSVDGGANLTLDVQYNHPVYGAVVNVPWITLDEYGQSWVCTDPSIPVGTYTITAVRNTVLSDWNTVSASIDVRPFNPTGLSFDRGSGHAGNTDACKTLTVSDGLDMWIDMRFQLSSEGYANTYQWGSHLLDSSGQYSSCDGHNVLPQTMKVIAIKNAVGDNWISLGAAVNWTVMPPQPTSLAFSPTTVNQGGSYTWAVGNGGNVLLDVKVTQTPPDPVLGGEWTGFSILTLDGSDPAHKTLSTDSAQPLGLYHVHHIKNNLNSDWVAVDGTMKVCPSAPGTVTVNPSSGVAGTSVSVTLTAAKMYCVTGLAQVSVSSGAISATNWSTPLNPTSTLTATFVIPSSAGVGTHGMRLTAGGGFSDFNFTVTSNSSPPPPPPPPPSPSVTGISVPSSGLGSVVSVTLNGSNLNGASLSANGWSGLSISGTSSSSSSVTALFTIAAGASVGTPTITVTTSNGSTSSNAFSIVNGVFWKQDYIRDGSGSIIATARPVPLDTTAPSTPTGLTSSSITTSSVHLSWTSSTDSGGSGLAGYRIYRQKSGSANLPVGTVGAGTIAFDDKTLITGTTYTYTVVAVDNAENYSNASTGVSVTTN